MNNAPIMPIAPATTFATALVLKVQGIIPATAYDLQHPRAAHLVPANGRATGRNTLERSSRSV